MRSNNGTHPLHRPAVKKNVPSLPKIAAWDIETEGLGGAFIIAALATCDNQRLLFHSLDAVLEWIVDHPEYRYLAHNASGYEFAYLYPLLYDWFDRVPNISIQPSIQGDTRLIQFRITQRQQVIGKHGKPTKAVKNVTLDLRDTLCLFNCDLASVAKAFCPELPKLKENVNFEKVTFNPDNPAHMEYLWRDCDILLAAYPKLWQQLQDSFGVEPGITAGSTAMRAFQATIPEGHVYYRVNPDAEDFIRKCYYGGLILPGRTIGHRKNQYAVDVNADYAWQMKAWEYPIGSPTATWFYKPDYQGFYHVIAGVPFELFDTLGFNPIPHRTESGLDYPSGTFETYLSNFEIEYATEKGCSIDVICGYYFTRTEKVFGAFVEICERLEHENGGVYKPTIKLLRNSLYGKFAAKRSHVALYFTKDDTREDKRCLIPYTNEVNGDIIEGMYLFQEESDANYMLPHWSAMVTAHARIYLMRFLEEAYRRGTSDYYCDTDSLKCDMDVLLDMVRDNALPIGIYYGEFKAEEICKDFIVLGPKCFFGKLESPERIDEITQPFNGKLDSSKGNSKEIIVKAKGIPQRKLKDPTIAEAVFEAALAALQGKKRKAGSESGREILFESVKSTMSIIKEKSHVRPEIKKRTITDIRNSAAWVYLENGDIRPHVLTTS